MEEHFNEKYIESEKYPSSTFIGKITEVTEWKKDGVHKVNAKGILDIHGVKVERTIPVTITIKNSKIIGNSTFNVKTVDHKIEIPKIVGEKIGEEIEISVKAVY